jgi:hypothetical protein
MKEKIKSYILLIEAWVKANPKKALVIGVFSLGVIVGGILF